MEIFLVLIFIAILVATFALIPGDGRGHTPEERSLRDWSDGTFPSLPFWQQPHR